MRTSTGIVIVQRVSGRKILKALDKYENQGRLPKGYEVSKDVVSRWAGDVEAYGVKAVMVDGVVSGVVNLDARISYALDQTYWGVTLHAIDSRQLFRVLKVVHGTLSLLDPCGGVPYAVEANGRLQRNHLKNLWPEHEYMRDEVSGKTVHFLNPIEKVAVENPHATKTITAMLPLIAA